MKSSKGSWLEVERAWARIAPVQFSSGERISGQKNQLRLCRLQTTLIGPKFSLEGARLFNRKKPPGFAADKFEKHFAKVEDETRVFENFRRLKISKTLSWNGFRQIDRSEPGLVISFRPKNWLEWAEKKIQRLCSSCLLKATPPFKFEEKMLIAPAGIQTHALSCHLQKPTS